MDKRQGTTIKCLIFLSILIQPSAPVGKTEALIRPHHITSLEADLFIAVPSKTNNGNDLSAFKSSLFNEEDHAMFERDGFLVVSGLLEQEIGELVSAGEAFLQASQKTNGYFSSIEMGMIFQAGNVENKSITQAFRRVALDSVLPQAVAELMRLPINENVRVLRYVHCRFG